MIHIENSLQGYRAWGMLFKKGGSKIIAETSSRQFIGYTKSEIRRILNTEMKKEASKNEHL